MTEKIDREWKVRGCLGLSLARCKLTYCQGTSHIDIQPVEGGFDDEMDGNSDDDDDDDDEEEVISFMGM